MLLLLPPDAEITGLWADPVCVRPGIQPGNPCMLGRHPTTWAAFLAATCNLTTILLQPGN